MTTPLDLSAVDADLYEIRDCYDPEMPGSCWTGDALRVADRLRAEVERLRADHHDLVRDFGGPRPTITVLCGSTRFYDQFQQANYDLTMAGHIVLSVGFYPHAKAKHGHGEGVGHEIEYAEKVGKPVRYLVDLLAVTR